MVMFTICNGSPKTFPFLGTIFLVVHLDRGTDTLYLLVDTQLVNEVILCCDFCETYVEAILLRRRIVEIGKGSIVPIVCTLSGRNSKVSPLDGEELIKTKCNGRSLTKIKYTTQITIQSDNKTWVELSMKREILILVDPISKLFTNQICFLVSWLANVTYKKPFQILDDNFGWTLIKYIT